MIVFATGATGFIGQVFLQHLLRALTPTDEIRVLTRRANSWTDPRIRPIQGELEQDGDWLPSVADADWVFHLAADATFGKGEHYHRINVAPVERMLARLAGSTHLKRFVLVSTVGAVDRSPQDTVTLPLKVSSTPHPTSDYGRSKLEAESKVRASSLPFTIIRPGWVYGPGMRANSHLNVIARVVAQKPWAARLNWPGQVPLIHVEDLAAALVRCLTEPAAEGQTYFAVTENRSLGEIFRTLHESIHGHAPAQLPVPRFHAILGRVHSCLPLSISNLFLDYLAADEVPFRPLLSPHPIRWEQGRADLADRQLVKGSWWLVTGANSGIGRALVDTLLAEGARVIAVDRATDSLSPSENLHIVQADLTDDASLTKAATVAAENRLAGLINNAGVGFRGGLFERPWSEAETTVRVNILGTLHLTHLLKDQLQRDGTVIVNVASSVAYHPLPHMSVYAASKAFLLQWSLALSEELRATNCVVTFSPSGTRTNFQNSGNVKGAGDASLLDPTFVAREILRAARTGVRHRLLGAKSRILVGVSRLLPIAARLRLWRLIFAAKR
jgi:nucleoside-diphosphate-sugar epimerase